MVGDNRPYAEIEILGKKICGLLDSGAQISVAGADFDKIMNSLNIKPKRLDSVIRTADGTTHPVSVSFDLPVSYFERKETINVLFVPSVPKRLILGMDFWEAFRIKPIMCETIDVAKSIPVSELHKLDIVNAEKLQAILKKMPFAKDGVLSKTHLITHTIKTGLSEPIKQRHYIVSPYLQTQINDEIDRLLKLDVIEACEPSAWSSPMVAVKKTSGKIRLCIDARKLNEITEKDAYPQQNINRILGRLAGTTVLSSIDFSDAFLQVPLEDSSQIKTAFAISGRGYFKYKRMPFGLCNSGATLCRLVDRIIGCDMEPFVFVYLDDIIVATPTFEKHFEILEKLAKRISDAGLTISVSKSRFCMKTLKYLGYIVSEEGLRPDPEKISAISNYPQPTNIKDVRRLLGLAGWYRRFIPDFASISAPITSLLKKTKMKFDWTDQAQQAFEQIKTRLSSSPVLANPDYEKPFIVQTDASDVGIGGILIQGEGESERVIAYWSQKLSSAQRKYQTTERECLAVITAIEKFRPFIEGCRFTVITDHASLLWLQNLKDPAGRLGRWALRLQAYDFELRHRKGKFMVVADALSRAIESVDVCNSSKTVSVDPWYENLKNKVINESDKYEQFKVVGNSLLKYCSRSRLNRSSNINWRVVLPKQERAEVLRSNHDDVLSAHGGFFKTSDRVKRKYYWPKMDEDIRNYVRNCEVCKATKPTNKVQKSPMGKYREANRPWEMICIDFVGPLPRSRKGNCYMLVVVDVFSKFVHIHPMRSATTQATVKCLEEHIFLTFGVPRYLISDNGSQFTSFDFKKFLSSYNVTSWYTSRYHPQANAAEAANKTAETAIRAYLKDEKNHKNWDRNVAKIACAMNTSKHTSTMQSPYFVNFGMQMFTSGEEYDKDTVNPPEEDTKFDKLQETRELVKIQLRKSYETNKHRYDLRTRPIKYAVGDTVWLKTRVLSNAIKGIIEKFSPNYKKVKINRAIGSNSYEVADENGKIIGIYNTDCLKK